MNRSNFTLAIPNHQPVSSSYSVTDNVFMINQFPYNIDETYQFSEIMTSSIGDILLKLAQNAVYGAFSDCNQCLILNCCNRDLLLTIKVASILLEQIYQQTVALAEQFEHLNVDIRLSAALFKDQEQHDLFQTSNTKINNKNQSSLLKVDIPTFSALQAKLQAIQLLVADAKYSNFMLKDEFSFPNDQGQILTNNITIFVNCLPSQDKNGKNLKMQSHQLNQIIRMFEQRNRFPPSSNSFLRTLQIQLSDENVCLQSVCFILDSVLNLTGEPAECKEQTNLQYLAKNIKSKQSSSGSIYNFDYQFFVVQQFSLMAGIVSKYSATAVGMDENDKLEHLQKSTDLLEEQYQHLLSDYHVVLNQKKTQLKQQQIEFVQQIIDEFQQQDLETNEQREREEEDRRLDQSVRSKEVEFVARPRTQQSELTQIISKTEGTMNQLETKILHEKLRQKVRRQDLLQQSDKDEVLQAQQTLIASLIQQSCQVGQQAEIEELVNAKLLNQQVSKQQQLQVSTKQIDNQQKFRGLCESEGNIELVETQQQIPVEERKLTILRNEVLDLNIIVSKSTLKSLKIASEVKSLFELGGADWLESEIIELQSFTKVVNGFVALILTDYLLVYPEVEHPFYVGLIRQCLNKSEVVEGDEVLY